MARLRCDACGQRLLARVRGAYEYQIQYDSRGPYTIRIPDLEFIECTNPSCARESPDHTILHDDATTWRVTIETYRQLGLLTPHEIRAGREALGLNQQELQELLGLGGNSLSRWENGRIYQSRSMNTLLRLVFDVPEAVRRLRGGERYSFHYLDQLGSPASREARVAAQASPFKSPREFRTAMAAA